MAHSRRKALTAGLALVFAAPVAGLAAAVEPDAELIRLCAEFDALEQAKIALDGEHPSGSAGEQAEDAERDRLTAQQNRLVDSIYELPCTSSAGIHALGKSLAGYLSPEDLEDEAAYDTENALLIALLRAVTQGQGKQAARPPAPVLAPPPSPDAALIALCGRYVEVEREYQATSAQQVRLDFCDPEYQRLNRAACTLIPSIHAMRDQIASTPAVTLDGVRAKATAARYMMSVDTDTAQPSLMREEDAGAWSLVQDVLRIA